MQRNQKVTEFEQKKVELRVDVLAACETQHQNKQKERKMRRREEEERGGPGALVKVSMVI